MDISEDKTFFESVLNSLTPQIAVIDRQGSIQWVNDAWKLFSKENGGNRIDIWRDTNYIDACASSAEQGDKDATNAMNGIRRVIEGSESGFYLEYPCHSPDKNRWFMMRVRPLGNRRHDFFIVTHENITERKEAEMRIEELSLRDGLTGLANRRRFDAFLADAWRRATRLKHPVSLALLDLDFFKRYNDNYGHPAGDKCLQSVGNLLQNFSRRPDDLAARYGGEEFAIILGNTEKENASIIAEQVRSSIEELQIPHRFSTQSGCITISIGVATLHPAESPDASPDDLINAADRALYEAKNRGRNRVCALT